MLQRTFWERLMHVLRTNISLAVIVVAALLLELTTGLMYYRAQTIIQRTMERLVESEMNVIYLNIRNQLDKALVSTDSLPAHEMTWLDGLLNEGKMYKSTQRFLVAGDYRLLAGDDCQIYKEAVEQLKADNDRQGYVILDDEHGHKKHVFYAPVGGTTDWALINALDDSEVFGHLRLMRRLLLFLALSGLLIAGFIVWRASRHLERLHQVNAAKDRIDNELRIAGDIQMQMLPAWSPQSLREDIDICGSLVPAREVGGDLFDYFVRDEKLFFCIGDVSGKGVPSALLMAVTHSLFRSASAHENNPARIMQTINEISCQGNESNMFVTMFLGILDLPTGRLSYCDAGQDAPVIVGREALPVKPHIPLGLFRDFTYEMQETTLESGSMLFLYTDGLTEARSPEHKLFGLDRVMSALGGLAALTPEQLLQKMTREVHAFVEGADQSDDLTMLALRYTPVRRPLVLSEQLSLQNDIRQIPTLNRFVKQVLSRMGVEPSLIRRLQLAVEEAVVNVMEYAYPAGVTGDISLQISSDGQNLTFVIKDQGVAFDPTMKEKPDTTLAAEDRPIGGLGILLVRELMDSINYTRTEGVNVLTLKKIIPHQT